ncbi:hypothetical protein [Meridianimarinicoccus aquatilis]|uniref:hypothetical protein n=1 Tax=Meridianimarinicoccus aquatilis TaxID=2552766 RepID=UPI0014049C7E|nr:hypothetical protein [Fluviibacterium aquatile]
MTAVRLLTVLAMWLAFTVRPVAADELCIAGGNAASEQSISIFQDPIEIASDVPRMVEIDLDKNGTVDVKLELISGASSTPVSGLEVTTLLRIAAESGVGIGIGGPIKAGDTFRRSDMFYRAETLARSQRNLKTSLFYGEWARSPEVVSGILPLRLIRCAEVYLGYLNLSVDGYGNVTVHGYAVTNEPALELTVIDLSGAAADPASAADDVTTPEREHTRQHEERNQLASLEKQL